MRTTLDLPEKLVKQTMKVTNQRTKTAAIIAAMEEAVRRRALQEIKSYKGKVNLEIDLDALRGRK